VSCGCLCKREKKSTQFVRLVLTEVRVAILIIFTAAAAESLSGVATGRERGGRAGSSYELDAARSNQNKLIYHILDIPGGIFLKAPEASKFSLLLVVMQKYTFDVIFARRLLKTK
jgi:hypothetical protein